MTAFTPPVEVIDEEFPAMPSPAQLDAQYASAPAQQPYAAPDPTQGYVAPPVAYVAPQPVVTATLPEPVFVPSVAEQAAAQTPVVPDPPRDEAERIEPDVTGPVLLQSGKQVEIVPLKLRETMKLLKIVTRGAGPVLEQLMGGMDLNDAGAFAQTLGALIVMSIPEAENEAVEFIQSMVRPAGFDSLPQDQKIAQLNALMVELINPELEDVISIIERVVRRESEDIRNLGKRLSAAFKIGQKVGEIPVPTARS
jgi:hypothetical protein